MRIDFSRPYAEVHGRDGRLYEQDGHNFRPDGSCIDEEVLIETASPPLPKVPPKATRRQSLRSETILRQQFGDELDALEIAIPQALRRDVLAAYRDPQNADGSMQKPARVWEDGV